MRKELRRWLRRLHDDLNVTTIFVTHDQEEALEVADRVVVMNQGQRSNKWAAPQDVWDHPASPFVYGFLGDVNLFHGRAHEGEMHMALKTRPCVSPVPSTTPRKTPKPLPMCARTIWMCVATTLARITRAVSWLS